MAKVKSVFLTNFFEQKKTVETIVEESRADTDFYLMLGGSTIITTLGLLLGSSIAVVGGMLVAPLLFPILSLGMGIATSSRDAIERALSILLESIGIVLLFSLLLAFLMLTSQETLGGVNEVITLASQATIGHFLIALVSGIVASFTWVRQKINASLPGVAVSVSLIPPLATVGVGIAMLEMNIVSGALFLFLLNLLGIILASAIVFALFGFSNMHELQEKIIEKEEAQEAKKNGDKGRKDDHEAPDRE